MGKGSIASDEESKPTVAKTSVELQRFKLEKLMKNPDKPVVIPERVKEKKMPHVPEFVRNVMGSSAGAGSGEFHVYRHLRRKEYARQKFIQEKSEKQLLEEAYHQKLLDNIQAAEEKTSKKRAKRLRKKQNYKKNKFKKSKGNNCSQSQTESYSESDSEAEDGEDKQDSCTDKNVNRNLGFNYKQDEDLNQIIKESAVCETNSVVEPIRERTVVHDKVTECKEEERVT